jgi:oligoribonuclease NrnB/cAMP/cGMP phosphodiesterase (DHH superfamily)
MTKPVILYHENCPDGFGAAFAAWKKFGGKAEYAPIPPGQTPDQLAGLALKNREVYFLDVCASLPMLLKLRVMNKKVVVIDHHATNAAYARHATEHRFDITHSGAVLAWQYFHPKKKVPTLLKYVENSDLWKFSLPHVNELTTYTYAQPRDFKVWDALARDFESKRKQKQFAAQGKLIGAYEKLLVGGLLAKAGAVQFGKYKVLAVNSSIKRFASVLGHEFAKKMPPIGIVWYVENGDIKVSLRGNGTVDVGKLAAQFPGGGGHPNAAGFSVPLKGGFPWKVVESR